MILSIESSCDDSSIALTSLDSNKLLFHLKLSQDDEHNKFGGVVPEIASRLHTKTLPELLTKTKEFLNENLKGLDSIKAIAVTSEPGLIVSLIEGVMMAKTLALSLNIPLISINHLIGHFYSLFIDEPNVIFPLSALLVSGGHTQIIEAKNHNEFKVIANSLDDSFGESFDKVSKMLKGDYPGGPYIEKLAKNYTEFKLDSSFSLPLPLKDSKDIAFSFSGLKNATRLLIEKELESKNLDSSFKEKLAFSFQKASIQHITHQLNRYFKNNNIKHFAIIGGASQNLTLRSEVEKLCNQYNIKLLLAPIQFCADNAAMIGRAAIYKFKNKDFIDPLNLEPSPRSTAREFMC